jgi:hypothetical protein
MENLPANKDEAGKVSNLSGNMTGRQAQRLLISQSVIVLSVSVLGIA